MTREEFEQEYAGRHMGYDPRPLDLKAKSVYKQRQENRYVDGHMDLCWKWQQAKNLCGADMLDLMALNTFVEMMEW